MATMKQLTVLAVLSLCCTSLTSGTGDCHPEGPENCNIAPREYSQLYRTVCSWSLGSNFTFYTRYVGLTRNRQEGKLTSRRACSTGGQTHCLRFWYKFEQDNIIYLSVSIQYDRNDETESPLWIMSSSNGWNLARVPIITDRNFTVVFKAKRRPAYTSSSDSVFIDLISYSTLPCPSGLYPANAKPTTTTASTSITTTKSTTLATSTTPATKPADSTPTMSITTTLESDGDTTSSKSNNVGNIVGVMVALLVVIVTVIAVFLVFRRKNILFWKTCCINKQPKEQLHVNASHNVAYSLNADDLNNEVVTNHTQQNSENHRLEARTSTYSSTNTCYENTPPNNQSGPVYAIVNKPRKVTQETLPENQTKPNLTVYEMFNEEAAICSNAAGTEYQNLPPTMAKQEHDGQNNSSIPLPILPSGYSMTQPQNSSSVYHILEKEPGTDSNSVHHVPNASVKATAQGQDEEYNKLDFDTKGCNEAHHFDQEKSEKATGGVYSHLNEGDGDTYNEVHREKRDEVIDGVYSHIT